VCDETQNDCNEKGESEDIEDILKEYALNEDGSQGMWSLTPNLA
jgi:hypothetical protein